MTERVSSVAARLEIEAKDAVRKLLDLNKQSDYLYFSLKRIATYSAIFGFFYALKNVIDDVWETELRLAEVQTLLERGNVQAAASFVKVRQQLLSLNPYLGTSTELARGLYEIMSAGVSDPVEALKLLVTSAKYAKVGLTDLSTSAAMLTSVMKAYGFGADYMRKMTDVLFTSVAEGKFHVADLNGAIGNVLPTAAAMGVSVEEVSAALALLSNRGLSASESATALNRLLLSMLRPLDKSKEWFTKLGIEWGINALKGKGLVGVLEELTLASARYSNLLPEIFRRETGLRAAFALTGDLQGYKNLLDRMSKSYEGLGVVEDSFAVINNTVKMQLAATRAEIAQAANQLMNYSGAVSKVVDITGKFIVTMIKSPIAFASMISVLGTLISMKGKLVQQAHTAQIALSTLSLTVAKGTDKYNARRNVLNAVIDTKSKWIAVLNKAILITGAAALVYSLAKAALDDWHKSLDQGIDKINKQTDALGRLVQRRKELQELDSMGIITTTFLESFGAFEQRSLRVQEIVLNMIKGSKNLEVVVKSLSKALEEQGYVYDELGKDVVFPAAIGKIRGEVLRFVTTLQEGKQPGVEFNAMIQTLARYLGVSLEVQTKFNKALEEFTPGVEAASDAAKIYGRDIQDIIRNLSAPAGEFALEFDQAKLRAMLNAIAAVFDPEKSAEAKEIRRNILSWFNINLDDPELKRKLLAIKPVLEEAFRIEPFTKFNEAVKDMENSVVGALKKVVLTSNEANIIAQALWNTWNSYKGIISEKDFVAVSFIKEQFELLKVNIDRVPPSLRDFVTQFIDLTKSGKTQMEKMMADFKSITERGENDRLQILSNMAKIEDELNGEKYMRAVEQADKDIIKYKQNAEEKLMLTLATQQNEKTAYEEFYSRLRLLDAYHNSTLALAQEKGFDKQVEDLTMFFKKYRGVYQKEIIKVIDTVRTRLLMLKAIFPSLTAPVNLLLTVLDKTAEKLNELSDSAKENYSALDSLGDAFSNIATLMNDIKTSAGGAREGFVRIINIVDALAKGFSGISNAYRAWTTATRDIQNNTVKTLAQTAAWIGGIGSAIGALVSIFSTLMGTEETLQEDLPVTVRLIERLNNLFELLLSTGKDLDEVFSSFFPNLNSLSNRLYSQMLASLSEIATAWDVLFVAINEYTAGHLTAGEATEFLGRAFLKLVELHERLGTTGGKVWAEFLRRLKEAGLYVKEISEYINKQLGVVEKPFISAAEGLRLMAESGKVSLQDLANQTLLVFNAMIENGVSYLDALNSIGPALDIIIEKYKEQGASGNAAFDALIRFRELVTVNKDLFNAIEGNLAVLSALANVGAITQESFAAASVQAYSYHQQLLKAGFTEDEALQAMLPTLQKLYFLQQEYGFTLDANTQSLIDQAKAQGKLDEKAMTTVDVMLAGFGLIIKALGFDIPEAMQTAIDSLYDLDKKVTKLPANEGYEKLEKNWDDFAINGEGAIDAVIDRLTVLTGPSGMSFLINSIGAATSAFRELNNAASFGGSSFGNAFGTVPLSYAGKIEDNSQEIKGLLREIADNVNVPPTIEFDAPIVIQKDDRYEITLVQKAFNKGLLQVPLSTVRG